MQIFDYGNKSALNSDAEKDRKKREKEAKALEENRKKEKEIQDDIMRVRRIIENNMVEFHNLEYREYIDDYKRYLGDVSERMQYIEPGQSNASHPLVFMMVDTMFGTVFDFDYQLELRTKGLEKACVEAYDFMNKSKRAIGEAAKEALIIGKSIVRDYTYFEEGKYEVFNEDIEYEIKSPTMEYISAFNVMYDRMRGLNNSTYKIIRHFLTKKEILNKIKGILSPSVFEAQKKKLEETIDKLKEDGSNNSFSYYNYEAIKGLLFTDVFQRRIINQMNNDVNKNEKDKVKYAFNVDTVENINDLNKNKASGVCLNNLTNSLFLNDFTTKYEIIEFIEGNYKYFFINGDFIFKTEINPHIYNLSAFHFNEIPGSGKSVGLAFILKPLVDACNAMLNMFFDSIKLGNTVIFKQQGLGKKESHVKLRQGMILDGDIARINLGGNDFAGFNGLQALQNIAQSTVGVGDMIMGGDARVQRIAGAFDFAFSQYKSRLTPFTDSIDMAMSKIVKGWICQYLAYYTQEELEDLFDIIIEKKKVKGKTDFLIDGISVKDILNENNISFKFDSMFNLKKDNLKKTAMDIFQLAQQYNNEKVDGIKLLKLLAGDDTIKLEEILGIKDEGLEDVLDNTLDNGLNNSSDLNGIENILGGAQGKIPQNLSLEQGGIQEGYNIPEGNEELLYDENLDNNVDVELSDEDIKALEQNINNKNGGDIDYKNIGGFL